MRISIRHGFAFLAMPKCASTSIEKSLDIYSDILLNGGPGLKHTDYRRYSKYIKPFIGSLKKNKKKEIETICIMREPINWLHSWYRYRKRDELNGKPNSTKNMDFNEFSEKYISGEIGLIKQYDFIKNKDGEVGVDKIFPYENMGLVQKYFEEKIGRKILFPEINISKREKLHLDDELREMLRRYFKNDYKVYDSIQ